MLSGMKTRRQFLGLSGLALAGLGASAWPDEKEPAAMDAKNRTGLLADAVSKEHLTGAGHPEQPARFDAVLKGLRDAGLDGKLAKIDSRPATEAELAACHPAKYIAIAKRDSLSGAKQLSTGDTALCEKSHDTALRAAGGVLQAVDAVLEGKTRNAFCAVRPPGHHARPEQGMGFCIFNNIAVAARYAQAKHKVGKVLIADWDVHHGNGTQDIFYEDDSVFFFSTHQSPWYPGTGKAEETGAGKGLGSTLNCPYPAGAGRKEILEDAFQGKLAPAMKKFKPELILISAGFDSREGDPLGKFKLADADFADLTKLMLELSREHANGRLVSVLEGGYHLEGLAGAAASHVKALMEQ
jgi:acetoin utilization deacetylase AcuC-like enzyme